MTRRDDSLAYLFGRLGVVETRVRAAVHFRRADAGTDPFRGLYITDDEIDRHLSEGPLPAVPPVLAADHLRATVEEAADDAEAAGSVLRLRRLARSFELSELDVDILLIALAPDLDPRFERLYGYLHDDVTRRRASAGLALELSGAASGSGVERARLHPYAPLVAGGLLIVEDDDRPFLTRSLRVPDRVAAHLLGDDTPDKSVMDLQTHCVEVEVEGVDLLARAVAEGQRLVYIQEHPGSAGRAMATAALRRIGMPTIHIDFGRLEPGLDGRGAALAAAREARLLAGALVAGPIEALIDTDATLIRVFAEQPGTIVLLGQPTCEPAWSREPPLVLRAGGPSADERRRLWLDALQRDLPGDPVTATASFRLTPEQISRAAVAARRRADAGGRPVEIEDLRAGARGQNGSGLERLAGRTEPVATWQDIIAAPDVLVRLRELASRLRHRDHVLDEWEMGRSSGVGRGVSCLFAGPSGTGKSLAAEILARELGLDLYAIDVSTVVDKYVGETEKNLDRIFTEADRVNGVLLFDEADALFGKRSEVKDARDRWANVEVAYLLQRMEQFDGLAILTTNLRANLDEAFTRRLDAVIEFPIPDERRRAQLWELHLGSKAPLASDIDPQFLASSFKLSGGNIRNLVVTAAYLAAEEDSAISMRHLIRATEREYRKLGRLCLEAEFGPYYELVAASR